MTAIRGYDNVEIAVREENDFDGLVGIVYPGQGYTLSAPSLFYLHPIFAERRIHYFGVDLRYGDNMEFMKSDPETRTKWIDIDSELIGEYVKKKTKKFKKRIFIAKSLGTALLYNQIKGGYVSNGDILIFQTPIVAFDELQGLLIAKDIPSLIVYGTEDPVMLRRSFPRIKTERNVAVLEIENAGHSFEVGNEIESSIDNLKRVMTGINDFLGIALAL